ncbi:LysM domain-containing protein [Krasilnikovia cinnamomea]|uniref:LysM domain-containing protein n=1 Tax=Krasilnikovia cinnamomea TaxID=349313 RepID=A0A4Q7ZCV4_9ACTN|nr:LysM peptidoglycan-binding domain-containing protein [Krasilnikovia cinnamomea]RZU48468.1 LysM domain-containing protein [Krasilnikovia cinnamomea]
MTAPTAPAKAFLLTEKKDRIDFLFNPAELTITKANTWNAAENKGGNAPELRFQAGQSGTLALSITLDTTATGEDVTDYTNKLLDLLKVDSSLPGSDKQRNKARPPWVEFHWGKLHSFKAIVERLQLKFTYFASNGMPLRAKADLALKQYKDEGKPLLQNPTSHTPTLHTVHRLGFGETLDRVAARHYADATRWRLIAAANGVVDPIGLAPGTLLVIPELPVRRRG